MKIDYKDSLVRLIIAVPLNILLLECFIEQNREELAFLGGAFATVTLVLIAKVFWRGARWQIGLATLLAAVPARVLFQTLKLWLRGY